MFRRKQTKLMPKSKEEYYEMQRPNLLYPNEKYIYSPENVNKADLIRMTYVYEHNQNLEGHMLDVGCNDGFLMRHFDWKFESYTGVDMFSISDYLNTNNIDAFTKNAKIKYVTGLIEELELTQTYDFIFCGEIIEHVYDVPRFLDKLKQLSVRGGVIVFTTPNNVGLEQAEHCRQYNKRQLKKDLQHFFYVSEIVELPAINESWPFLYAKCINNIKL